MGKEGVAFLISPRWSPHCTCTYRPCWSGSASYLLPFPGLMGSTWGSFPQSREVGGGARSSPRRQLHCAQGCLAIVGRGDLAHYRGGKRIKSSWGWKSGVGERMLLPWKLPAWSLAVAGYFWAGVCSLLRGFGVVSRPVISHNGGGDHREAPVARGLYGRCVLSMGPV